jgi:hypothetical protein
LWDIVKENERMMTITCRTLTTWGRLSNLRFRYSDIIGPRSYSAPKTIQGNHHPSST